MEPHVPSWPLFGAPRHTTPHHPKTSDVRPYSLRRNVDYGFRSRHYSSDQLGSLSATSRHGYNTRSTWGFALSSSLQTSIGATGKCVKRHFDKHERPAPRFS